jgi:hypothetical protein
MQMSANKRAQTFLLDHCAEASRSQNIHTARGGIVVRRTEHPRSLTRSGSLKKTSGALELAQDGRLECCGDN